RDAEDRVAPYRISGGSGTDADRVDVRFTAPPHERDETGDLASLDVSGHDVVQAFQTGLRECFAHGNARRLVRCVGAFQREAGSFSREAASASIRPRVPSSRIPTGSRPSRNASCSVNTMRVPEPAGSSSTLIIEIEIFVSSNHMSYVKTKRSFST